jgi:hypothetical protein
MGASAAGFGALTGAAIALARVTSDRWSAATATGGTAAGGTVGPDQLLVLGAAGAALLLASWLILGTVAALVAHLPGRVGLLAGWMAAHWAPALSRRVAAALVGAATMGSLTPAAGIAAPAPPTVSAPPAATATTADGPGFTSTAPFTGAGPWNSKGPIVSAESGAADQSGQPGWVPARPVVAPAAAPRLLTTTPTRPHPDGEVVVHRGDTLWDLARRQLGPRASDAEVAEAWPQWYTANRAVIGADPGRLLPGQLLVAPEPRTPLAPEADRQAHR